MIAEESAVTDMLIGWRAKITPEVSAIMYAIAEELGYVEWARGMDLQVLRQGDFQTLALSNDELDRLARAAAVLAVVDRQPNRWLLVAEVAAGRFDERGAHLKPIGERLDPASLERLHDVASNAAYKIVAGADVPGQ